MGNTTKDEKGRDLILMKSGEPFATRRAATLQRGVHKNKGVETKVVEIEGGFALEILPEEYRRPDRTSLSTRNVLTAPQRPGFHRRFVNDTGDRVEIFLDRGWNVVTDDELHVGDPRAGKDTHVGSPVTKAVGLGVTAVLMEIPQELYDKRQAEKAKEINKAERAMMMQGEQEGAYGGVKIGTKGTL